MDGTEEVDGVGRRWVVRTVAVAAVLAASTAAIFLGPLRGPFFPALRGQGGPDPATLIPGCTVEHASSPLTRRYPRGALADFTASVAACKRLNRTKAFLVEHHMEWIRKIGVNGMLDSFESADPKCHAVGHEVGRAAVRVNCGLDELLRACGTRCSTGCFHGIILGFMVDLRLAAGSVGGTAAHRSEQGEAGAVEGTSVVGLGQVHVDGVMLRALCGHRAVQAAFGLGECYHAVGHAILVLAGGTGNQVAAAQACESLLAGEGQMAAQHHCGTGVFMEAMRSQGWSQHLAPCNETRLVGACFLYRWRWMGGWRGGDTVGWAVQQVPRCAALQKGGSSRAPGCIFGLAAHVGEELIIRGEEGGQPGEEGVRIVRNLCGSEGVRSVPGGRQACLDGLMLRAAKYYPPGVVRAACESVPKEHGQACLAAASWGMYSMSSNSSSSRYVLV